MTRRSEDDGDPSISELLEVDRELSGEERQRLRAVSDAAWADAGDAARLVAREVYSVAEEEQFRFCLTNHLDIRERLVMSEAEVYNCCICGRLLKDRNTPVASAILIERRRLAELLTEAERIPEGPERRRLWTRFRAALGLNT